MADITQTTDGDVVEFSPNTNNADLWMREVYSGSFNTSTVKAVFSLSGQREDILEFKKSASEAGFIVKSL